MAPINGNFGWAYYNPTLQFVAHEIGHSLGLYHTFNSSESEDHRENVHGIDDPNLCLCECSKKGDMVCDTPADPYQEDVYEDEELLTGCEFTNQEELEDNCDILFEDEEDILPTNIMSYYKQNCIYVFTDGQNIRMRYTIPMYHGDKLIEGGEPVYPFDTDYNFTGTDIWTDNKNYDNDFTINGDLTILGADINLTPGHKIILTPGSSLTASGTKFDVYSGIGCYDQLNGQWNGIELQGGGCELSFYGSTWLTNATVGVYNSQGISGSNTFNATSSYIYNNSQAFNFSGGVEVFGEIKNCIISLDVDIIDDPVSPYIYLRTPNPFGFWNCDLVNYLSVELTGIEAYGGALTYSWFFENNAKIEGWDIGILSTNMAGGVQLLGTDCLNNEKTLEVKLASFANVFESKIEASSSTSGQRFAVNLTNVSTFEVLKNDFLGEEGDNDVGLLSGWFIDNNNANNIVYNNFFENLWDGVIVSGDQGDGNEGIRLHCNYFEGTNLKDMRWASDVASDQGVATKASGNNFSYNGDADINYEGSNAVDYYHGITGNQFPLEIDGAGAMKITPKIAPANTDCDAGISWPPAGDPPTTIDNCPNLEGPFTQFENLLDSLRNELEQLLDGGNTSSVVGMIVNKSATHPSFVLYELGLLAPYLSTDVILTLFDYSSYYTEEEIRDIISMNTDILSNDCISETIFGLSNFSQASIDSIILAFSNGTSRTQLHLDISKSLDGRDSLSRLAIQKCLQNSDVEYGDIRKWLQRNEDFISLLFAAETYFYEGRYQPGLDYLDSISRTNLKQEQLDDLDNFIEVKNILTDAYNDGRAEETLTSSEQDSIHNIAVLYEGFAAIYAQNLLEFFWEKEFLDLIPDPIQCGKTLTFRGSTPRSNQSLGERPARIQLVPNPSNGLFTVILDSDMSGRYVIRIHNLFGEVLKVKKLDSSSKYTNLNLSDFNPGTYIYEIVDKHKLIDSGKFVIVK